jgi:hypothetical protein
MKISRAKYPGGLDPFALDEPNMLLQSSSWETLATARCLLEYLSCRAPRGRSWSVASQPSPRSVAELGVGALRHHNDGGHELRCAFCRTRLIPPRQRQVITMCHRCRIQAVMVNPSKG